MEQKLIGAGLVTLILGFALGYVAAPNKGDFGTQIASALAPTGDAINTGVSGLGDAISALNARLDALETSIASSAQAAADTTGLDALGARLDALSGDIGATLSQTQEDIAARIDGLGAKMSVVPAAAAATVPAAAAEPDQAAAAEPQPTAPDNAGPAKGLTAGESAVFADGAVRAFVSMVGESTARLSVNGDLTTMAAGESLNVGDCLLTLEAIDRGHADISGACGAEVPAATGFGPGESAMFDDGATRVFVSGVSADGSAARLAVNGLGMQSVSVGDSVPVGGDSGCAVMLQGIDRGHVQLGYACGS